MTTTRALVDEGADRLRSLGMDTPRLDTELLLAHAIGVDRTAVVAHGDAPVGASAEEKFHAFLERRAAGEPVAYIRGMKEFHGIALTVDSRALIPRPETEALVDLVLGETMGRLTSAVRAVGPLRIIDVGTGSGALAIALAVALRKRRVPAEDVAITAVDVSDEALDLARENAVGHAVGDRLSFAATDLLPADAGSSPWDVVVANLPYVRSDQMATLPVDVRFEPALALDGGPDGLLVIGRLLGALETGLAADGVAFLEIGADHGEDIVALVGERLPGWTCQVQADLAGLPRTAVVRRAAAG
jgi:release factor glutamine methyltransferase